MPFVHTNPASSVTENVAFRKRSPEWIDSKTPFSCSSVDGENGAFRKCSPEWIDSKTPFSCYSVDGENGAFRKRSPEWIHWKTPFSCCSVDGENGAFWKRSPEWMHSKTPFSCCSVDGKRSMRFRYKVSVFKRKRISVDVALDEGPTLEKLNLAFYIGSTRTFYILICISTLSPAFWLVELLTVYW